MAIKSYTDLLSKSNEIKNETVQGANTAPRVGGMFNDLLDSALNPVRQKVYVKKNSTLGKPYLVLDAGSASLDNLAVQIVYWSYRKKAWIPASGAGVKSVVFPGGTVNTSQVAIPGVTSIRCKRLLTANLTEIDLDDSTSVANLYTDLFLPYMTLKQYSFKNNLNNDALNWRLRYKIGRPSGKPNYHYHGILKTGLAITKSVNTNGFIKTHIVSDILQFKMWRDSGDNYLFVKIKGSPKLTHIF